VATDGGAIAAVWRHVREGGGYQARPEHEARNGKIFVVRDNWALLKGLMKLAGAQYTDQIEAPGELVILREASGIPRRIYLDGRGHPPDDEIVATWNGHSTGKWDGDVLVVDTVATNGRARAANGVGSNAKPSILDSDPRFPLSDALHLVERMRLVANNELLEDEITIEDAKYYTEKVVLKHYFQRRPDIDMLEYFCGDNPRRD